MLYRGLAGDLGLAIVVLHVALARHALPRTVWARRTTDATALLGVTAFSIALALSVAGAVALEADVLPSGSAQSSLGWWLLWALAVMAAALALGAAFAASRRGVTLAS